MDNGIAYAYIRYSSKKQDESDSYRRQVEIIQEYCARKKLTLSDEIFSDLGVSAYTHFNKREGFNRMLAMIDSGEIPKGSWIIMEHLDRMSREGSKRSISLISDISKSCNIAFINFGSFKKEEEDEDEDDYDDKDEEQKVQELRLTDRDSTNTIIEMVVTASKAYKESRDKGRRIHRSWHEKKKNIRKFIEEYPDSNKRILLTAKVPFYIEAEKTGTIKKIKKRNYELATLNIKDGYKETIQKVFELAKNSFSNQDIAIMLNKEAANDRDDWNSSRIQRLLTSRRVLGEHQPTRYLVVNDEHIHNPKFTYKGEVFSEEHLGKRYDLPDGDAIKNYYPKIINEDLFNEVQTVLLAKCTNGGGRKGKKFSNIFVKLNKCGVCGNGLTHNAKGKKRPHHKEKAYLRCRKGGDNNQCDAKAQFDYEIAEHNILAFCSNIDIDKMFEEKKPIISDLSKKKNSLELKIHDLKSKVEYLEKEFDNIGANDTEKDKIMNRKVLEKIADHTINISIHEEQLKSLEYKIVASKKNVRNSNKKLSDLLDKINKKDSKDLRQKLNHHLRSFIDEIHFVCGEKENSKDAVIVFVDKRVEAISLDFKLPLDYIGNLVYEFEHNVKEANDEVFAHHDSC